MPKVSVIIPIYGVEKFIERCARSLFKQTLDDMEFIFVNDCTPDRSIEILNEIIKEYPNRRRQIRIINHEHNKGLPSARKTGVSAASGEYIIHCDSDDWVDLSMYEILYKEAIRHNADIVFCDFFIAFSNGECMKISQKADDADGKTYIHRLLLQQVHGSCCNKLIRKSIISNDIEYPKYNMREDLALMIQIFYKARRVSYVNQGLYYYFSNTTSISNGLTYDSIENRFRQSVINYYLIEKFLERNSIKAEFEKDLAYVRFKIKTELARNTNDKRGITLWKSSFPDITVWKVMKLEASLILKIKFILASIGIYSLIKKLQEFLK